MNSSELKARVDELFGSWSLMPEQTPEGLMRYGREVSLLTELAALATRLAQTEDASDLAEVGDLIAMTRSNLASHDAAVWLTKAVEALRGLTNSLPVDPSNFVRMKRPGRSGTVIATGA